MTFLSLRIAPTMFVHLVTFSIAGTTLGFFLPQEYPSLAADVVVVLYLAGLGLALWRGEPATRRTAAAMAILAAAIYVVIAVGRSGMYAIFSISLLQAAHVARYHYVGSIPVVILGCLMLQRLSLLVPARLRSRAALAFVPALGAIMYGIVHVGVNIPDYPATPPYIQHATETIAAEVREHPPGDTVYLENDTTPGSILGPALPQALVPGRAGIFVLLHDSDQLDGRHVRFIERDAEVAAYYRTHANTRLARLLVTPDRKPFSR